MILSSGKCCSVQKAKVCEANCMLGTIEKRRLGFLPNRTRSDRTGGRLVFSPIHFNFIHCVNVRQHSKGRRDDGSRI